MSSIDRYIGLQIRYARRDKHLTARDLCDRLDLTEDKLAQYESGAVRCPASRLSELADTLDVPITYFYEGVSNDTNMTRGEGQSHPNERELERCMALFARIRSCDERAKILDMLELLADS